jgi:hypothetical protein
MNELQFTLLQQTHKYYPVGLRTDNLRYPGYTSFRSIIEQKISALIRNDSNAWTELVRKVSLQIEHGVFDQAYEQFPNYVLRVEMHKAAFGHFILDSHVYLVISLVTDFYTIFYQEDILVSNDSDKRVTMRCLSKVSAPKDAADAISILNRAAAEMFPKHNYIDHKTLFNFRIEGATPHGEDAEVVGNQRIPVFCFLFGQFLLFERTEILD